MICEQWQDRIAVYAGGDLPESEVAEVERHLVECPHCAELADSIAADRTRLQSRPPELPEIDFDAIRAELRGKIVRGRLIRRWTPVAAIAAALLVILAIPSKHPVLETPMPPAPVASVRPAAGRERPPKVEVRNRRVPPVAAVHPVDVEMRLTTNDPNVTIILLPVTTENSNE